MRKRNRVAKLTGMLCLGFALVGCQSIRDATGAAKQSPDEFAVVTYAPLVIPPDFNLRPPQPGIASRNRLDPAVLAQMALFPRSAAVQTASLGNGYSEGEILLLSKSNALNVDPNIRRTIVSDDGPENHGARSSVRRELAAAIPAPTHPVREEPRATTALASASETLSLRRRFER